MLYPLRFGRMRMRTARIVAGCGWVVALMLSLLPLSKTSAFGDSFYGRTGTPTLNLQRDRIDIFCLDMTSRLVVVSRGVSSVHCVESALAWLGVFCLHFPRPQLDIVSHYFYRV